MNRNRVPIRILIKNQAKLSAWIPVPKIFEYSGILIFFYSNEHEPLHVHAKYGEHENRAEFIIINGKITEIRISSMRGRDPLPGNKLNDFKDFLKIYADQVLEKWIDYFIYHKKVKFERITKKTKWKLLKNIRRII